MSEILQRVISYLLQHHFKSKRSMARAIGIDYRVLLNVCTEKVSAKVQKKVLLMLIHYCIQHGISLEHAIKI